MANTEVREWIPDQVRNDTPPSVIPGSDPESTPAKPDPTPSTGVHGNTASVLRDVLALVVKVAAICGVAALVFTFIYGLHRSADPDMDPAVKDGDLVVFYRIDKDYAAGDLVVFEAGGGQQVRRVVAIAGDTVDITDDGLIVNGALQQEQDIFEATPRYAEGTDLPVTLGEGEVFVLGDSRENATDSRVYGPVNTDDTQGTAIAIVRRRGL
jgi:signal peptidase I